MSSFGDAVEAALARLSKGKAPAVLRTLAMHAAQVLAMRADRTADLATDDGDVGGDGGLGGRPVLVGLPGVKLALAAGRRVRVAFEGGSDAAPEVLAFEQDGRAKDGIATVGKAVNVTFSATAVSALGVTTVVIFPHRDGVMRPDLAVTLSAIPQEITTDGLILTGSEEVFLV